jgi:hypothetical protein
MAFVYRDFSKYVLYYISKSSPAVGIPQDAEIDCFDSKGKRAGIIYFHPMGVPLPANRDTVNGIILHYHINRFEDSITTLRQEEPLYLALDTTRGAGYIGTTYEPIGE